MARPDALGELPSFWILAATFDAIRDRHTGKWCQEKLIGPTRAALKRSTPDDVATLPTPAEQAREKAEEALAAYCRGCGKCPLSKA